MSSDYLKPTIGKVSRHIAVAELIVRSVVTAEYDSRLYADSTDLNGGLEYEDRLQGRLANASKHRLTGVRYDLSYYDSNGRFLGLDKSKFLEDDEMDSDDEFPIDMKISLPDDTAKCVFNVRAKKPGAIAKYFWGN